jgi:hypothetical protein
VAHASREHDEMEATDMLLGRAVAMASLTAFAYRVVLFSLWCFINLTSFSRKDSGAQATRGEKRRGNETSQADRKCNREI